MIDLELDPTERRQPAPTSDQVEVEFAAQDWHSLRAFCNDCSEISRCPRNPAGREAVLGCPLVAEARARTDGGRLILHVHGGGW